MTELLFVVFIRFVFVRRGVFFLGEFEVMVDRVVFLCCLLLQHLQNGLLESFAEGCIHENFVILGVCLLRCCVCCFDLPEVLLNNSLLLHAFAPLLFFSVLVPETVKEDIFDLTASVDFSDRVQILFGFVSRHRFHVVYR